MWQGWIDVIVGAWLILCGFIASLQEASSMIIAGGLAVIFGFWSRTWQGTVVGCVGIWLLLSGIWFNLIVPWNFFLCGLVILALAIWNATRARADYGPGPHEQVPTR